MKQSKILISVVIGLVIGVVAFTTYKKQRGAEGSSTAIKKELEGKKVLVLFFSRAGDNYKVGTVKKGNTAFLAENIAEITGADIFEITSKKNYDIPYEEMLKVVRAERKNDEYPEFSKSLNDIDKYDIIFVGGPIWWGTYPRVMMSFFKKHNLNGKIIIPFTTNEGSGLGNAKVDVQTVYPEANVINGLAMSGQEARTPEAHEKVQEWLNNLNINNEIKLEKDLQKQNSLPSIKVNNPLTAKGKENEKQVIKTIYVTYENGRQEKIELVVKGPVDMGLGTLWSATNLGSNSPWEVGAHYAWGETAPKESFTENNYAYYKKLIGADIAKTKYDAAQKELGGDWRMPTKEEWSDLLFKTEHEWVTINGSQGYLFTATNGSKIFLPANGFIYDKEVGTPDEGYYWSSTFSNIENAHVSYLPSNSWGMSNYSRYIGIGIRYVK